MHATENQFCFGWEQITEILYVPTSEMKNENTQYRIVTQMFCCVRGGDAEETTSGDS